MDEILLWFFFVLICFCLFSLFFALFKQREKIRKIERELRKRFDVDMVKNHIMHRVRKRSVNNRFALFPEEIEEILDDEIKRK